MTRKPEVITNDQISELVDNLVKNDFIGKKQKKYAVALGEYENFLKQEDVTKYPTADDFVFACISLFEDMEDDGPDEIYKGLNREDIELLIDSIIKRFKEFLCDTFHRYPDTKFYDATQGIFEKNVEILVTSTLSAAGMAGIPAMYTGMLLVAYLIFLSKTQMQKICE